MLKMSGQRLDVVWKRTLPEANDNPDELALFQLFNEIGIINQLSSTAFERVLPHGLTQAQFTVLNHFIRLDLDDSTPARLASALQVTRGTLTSTLRRLEQKGFITLLPAPDDGRSKRVRLTPAGRKAREDAITATIPLLQRLSGSLTRQEIDTLLPRLQGLRIWLDQNR